MPSPQHLPDPQDPFRRAGRAVRVLQRAWAITFVVSALMGALSTQRLAALRAGAGAAELGRQMPLLVSAQVLY